VQAGRPPRHSAGSTVQQRIAAASAPAPALPPAAALSVGIPTSFMQATTAGQEGQGPAGLLESASDAAKHRKERGEEEPVSPHRSGLGRHIGELAGSQEVHAGTAVRQGSSPSSSAASISSLAGHL
jgi:hypothetical protein